MTKKIHGSNVFLLMDVLRINANQRYNAKLSNTQTANMIKFAVALRKECTITLNTFNVLKQPNRVVYQYVSYAGNSRNYNKRKLLEKL